MNSTRLSLVAELQKESPQAWSELDRLYRPLIRNWLGRYSLQANDLEDLTQDVLSIIFQEIRKFDHNGRTGAFRKWIRQTTVNVTRNFLRKRKEIGGGSEIQDMIVQLQDPQSDLSGQFEKQHDLFVMRRIVKLAESSFEQTSVDIFRYHVLEDHSAEKTAHHFDTALPNVYKVKSRMIRKMRELAADLIDDEYFREI
ncbi:MAG: sigma-70 family RNA polymerase sigma factor [Verrucomicrobiota bacterium]